MAQGTIEWKMRRLGKATASRIFDIVDTDKSGKPKASRENLLIDLAMETLSGEPTEIPVNRFMAEGTRQEPIARIRYSLETDADITQLDFVDHPTIPKSGASPDGLVGDDGFIEIKAPQPKTHLEYLLSEKIPPNYLCQIGWNFACMPERKWCDFVSFCDRAPEGLQMWIKRVERNDAFVQSLEREVEKFIHELDQRVETLRQRLKRSD